VLTSKQTMKETYAAENTHLTSMLRRWVIKLLKTS